MGDSIFKRRYPVRNLLMFDAYCGFSAGLVYSITFHFLLETLSVPRWLALAQLSANFSYSLIGLSILLSGRLQWFRVLIKMNFVYSALCAGFTLMLAADGRPWAALLLLGEALFVFVLAKVEQNSMVN